VHRIEPVFKFASVAMVGASDRPGMGSTVYNALRTLEYEGTYYQIKRSGVGTIRYAA
jgi:hypothetical protein